MEKISTKVNEKEGHCSGQGHIGTTSDKSKHILNLNPANSTNIDINSNKENNPNLRIAVGGCVASQEGENIIKKAPFVDLVFGPQTLHRLPEMLEKRERQGFSQIDVSFPEIEKFDNLPITTETKPCASVSIMEGCSKYCSFCVVPYTRGEEISRPLDEIIEEIIRLTLNGVKEVTLLGQNVNAYRGLMADGKIADFAMLLEYVSSIRDIKRIRFTTSHPNLSLIHI